MTPAIPPHLSHVIHPGPRSVPIGGGVQMEVDSSGSWAPRPAIKPPKYKQTQNRMRVVAQRTMTNFLSLNATTRTAQIDLLRRTADQTMALAQTTGSFTKGHSDRARRWSQSGDAAAFRALDDELDEASHSSTTGAEFEAMRQSVPTSASSSQRAHANAFMEESARLYSSMRMRTHYVTAPLRGASGGSSVVGQRHPTTSAMPTWPGAGSAHTQADRERAAASVTAAEGAPANEPAAAVISRALAASSYTARSMSLSLSASNVAGGHYPSTVQSQQPPQLEVFKAQTNVLASAINVPTAPGTQRPSSPVRPTLYPTSPRRTSTSSNSSAGSRPIP